MSDEENDDDDEAQEPYYAEFRAHEANIKAHENDPCDTPLHINIQALTMERLKEYCGMEKCSIEDAVNNFILDALYEEGC